MLNKKIRSVKPSATFAVKEQANKLRSQGRTIVGLGPGEPDIDTPDHIKQAAIDAMKAGYTKYTDISGILELRELIAKKITTENGIPTTADEVVVTAGGKQALASFFAVTLEPGDEVIISTPYWVSYPEMVRLADGVPVFVNTSANSKYRITAAELEASITEKTRVLILNSPSNPTGAAYSQRDFQQLAGVLKKYPKIMVVSDEVYEKIVYEPFQFISFAAAVPELASRTITVNAFSKTYSMTGWRVGYAAGPQEIVKAIKKYNAQTTSNPCSIAQYAALGALKGSHDFIDSMKTSFLRRIELVEELLASQELVQLPFKPEGAFYLFLRIDNCIGKTFNGKRINGSADFCEYVLDKAGVGIVPGIAFGDDGAVRVSVAASDEDVTAGIKGILSVLV